jgi:hypothetical protein
VRSSGAPQVPEPLLPKSHYVLFSQRHDTANPKRVQEEPANCPNRSLTHDGAIERGELVIHSFWRLKCV